MTNASRRLVRAVPAVLILWAIVLVAIGLASHRPKRATIEPPKIIQKKDREPMRPRLVVVCVGDHPFCVNEILTVIRARPDGWLNQVLTFEGHRLPASFINEEENDNVSAEDEDHDQRPAFR